MQSVLCLRTKAEFSISSVQWPINCVAKGQYAKKIKSYLINYYFYFLFFFLMSWEVAIAYISDQPTKVDLFPLCLYVGWISTSTIPSVRSVGWSYPLLSSSKEVEGGGVVVRWISNPFSNLFFSFNFLGIMADMAS